MSIRPFFLGLVLLLAGACSQEEEPITVCLARGFEPEIDAVQGLWIFTSIREDDWVEKEGHWLAPNPFEEGALPIDPRFDPELRSFEGNLPLLKRKERRNPRESAFRETSKGIRLFLPDHQWPTEEYQLGYRIAVGQPEELAIPREKPAWRVPLGKLMSDGIPVWFGAQHEVQLELGPDSRLEFATSCLGYPALGDERPQKLSIYLNDELYFSSAQEITTEVQVERHVVHLPRDLAGSVRLRFEVDRAGALTTVHNPVVTNVPKPQPGEGGPPVIVLFSADTFRADNMQAYGGTWGVTPELDRFAAESLVFRNAWSPAAWTLPAHASMFSGLHPYQHGSTRKLVRLNEELVLIAEMFAKAGYRTGAVTNALYVSGTYGMDRGFEWFEERLSTDLEGTLQAARDFLAAEDGRPTFLFVHTYRVHGPYRISNQTLDEYDDELALSEGMRVLRSLVREKKDQKREAEEGGGPKPVPLRHINFKGQWFSILRDHVRASGVEDPDRIEERVTHIAGSLERAYLGGVVDLDRAFGQFTEDLGRDGYLDRGYLVFTSDHGEAFGEHETMFHGHGVWDEVLRVPLLIHGRGVGRGIDERPASLIDLPATLAELGGFPAHPAWEGASLLSQVPGRDHLFLFDCADESVASAVVLDGGVKIAFPLVEGETLGTGEMRFAYDLTQDPAELRDLKGIDPDRLESILERRLEELGRVLEPIVETQKISESDRLQREMKALGY